MNPGCKHDDAGGGCRGLRAEPSADLFLFLREAFDIDADGRNARDLGGLSSLNLVVDGQWVARIYRWRTA